MGSVIESYRHFLEEKFNDNRFFLFLGAKLKNRKTRLYLGIFLVYFVAGFAFLAIGMQPIKNAGSVYAAESETAEESLEIPSISLSAPVKISTLTGRDLSVPEQIAGSYSMHENKFFIFGHSSTIFKDLKNLKVGDEIYYQNKKFLITKTEEKPKEDIDMAEILQAEVVPTVVLMTCSGNRIEETANDYTHRIIITAESKNA